MHPRYFPLNKNVGDFQAEIGAKVDHPGTAPLPAAKLVPVHLILSDDVSRDLNCPVSDEAHGISR
jgi:hypothetical protein